LIERCGRLLLSHPTHWRTAPRCRRRVYEFQYSDRRPTEFPEPTKRPFVGRPPSHKFGHRSTIVGVLRDRMPIAPVLPSALSMSSTRPLISASAFGPESRICSARHCVEVEVRYFERLPGENNSRVARNASSPKSLSAASPPCKPAPPGLARWRATITRARGLRATSYVPAAWRDGRPSPQHSIARSGWRRLAASARTGSSRRSVRRCGRPLPGHRYLACGHPRE